MTATIEEIDLEHLLDQPLPCQLRSCKAPGEEAVVHSRVRCPHCSWSGAKLLGSSCERDHVDWIRTSSQLPCPKCSQLIDSGQYITVTPL